MLEPEVGSLTSPFFTITASAQIEWITVLVSVQRPPPEALHALDRPKRMAALRENAEFHRRELILWIAREGLGTEVRWVSAATHFSIITIVCTSHAAKMLEQAPRVTAVIAVPEAALDFDVVIIHN